MVRAEWHALFVLRDWPLSAYVSLRRRAFSARRCLSDQAIAVFGSMIPCTSLTLVAGKPLNRACS